MKTVLEKISEYIIGLKYESLPSEVLNQTKKIMLDQFGIQYACSRLPWAAAVWRVISKQSSSGTSQVVYYGNRLSVEDAAYVNAVFGHSFEMDDISVFAPNHPGSHAVPAVFAISEAIGANGQQALTAAALCLEIICRFSYGTGRQILAKGINTHPPTSMFGTAAAASWLLGLDFTQTVNALSISASYAASGIREYNQSGGSVKRLYSAIPVQAGIRSTFLAKEGITGPFSAVEGPFGWGKFFVPDVTNWDFVTDKIGDKFHLMDIAQKPFPANSRIQPMIDAILRLKEKHGFDFAKVKSIVVGTDKETVRTVGTIKRPEDFTGVHWSASFLLAMALYKGAPSFRDFTEETLRDERILNLAQRISLEVDPIAEEEYHNPEFGHLHSLKLSISISDNNDISERYSCRLLKGTPWNPMSWSDITNKFMDVCADDLTEPRRRSVIEYVETLESAKQAFIPMELIRNSCNCSA